jgi:hypothetical protein
MTVGAMDSMSQDIRICFVGDSFVNGTVNGTGDRPSRSKWVSLAALV